jgi:hypothetical protein
VLGRFVISVTWVLHIILFLLPRARPIHPFLNDFFITLEEVGGSEPPGGARRESSCGARRQRRLPTVWYHCLRNLRDVAHVGCGERYASSVPCISNPRAGNFRFGARFLFFTLYPMELNNTMMNAFLFNTWLILVRAAYA